MKRVLLIATALLIVPTAITFAAQQAGNKNRPTFTQLDANSDGALAKEELRGPLLAYFTELDSDNSGTLSAAEFNNRSSIMGREGRKGKRKNRPTFEQLDRDGDGMLSEEEYNAPREGR